MGAFGKGPRVSYEEIVELVGMAVDAVGIVVIVLGVTVALARYVRDRGRSEDGDSSYHALRMRTGRSILLGLEFLVAGDIVRTVAVAPTFRSLGVLAGIVLIRTFLSFTLEMEISGRWPWQRRGEERAMEQSG
jgi:uncharacterized membrane protein